MEKGKSGKKDKERCSKKGGRKMTFNAEKPMFSVEKRKNYL